MDNSFKFPLKLSCGHFTHEFCNCLSNHKPVYQSNGDSPVDRALRDFNGRWRDVLASYGCNVPSSSKHGPCPVCGGKDRFRFDDKQGRGTWFCAQCDPNSGGGLLLLSRFIGKSTMETAKELVGDDESFKSVAPVRKFVVVDETEKRKADIAKAKIAAENLLSTAKPHTHEYMINKGLNQEFLTNGDLIYGKDNKWIAPHHFLFVPVYKNGELVNMQRITPEGEKKPIYGGDMKDVYHCIEGQIENVAVVEGYATGITVNMLTTFKTYCAFNTGNLAAAAKQAKKDYPNANIVIFADHDKVDEKRNYQPGKYYAESAAVPVKATVAMPPELGDWDDYRQAHGNDDCKAAMRKAIVEDRKKMQPAPVKKPVVVVEKPTPKPEPTPKPVVAPVENKPMNFPSAKQMNFPSANQTQPAPQAAPKKPQGLKALPEGVCFDNVDIDSPPGLAGDIVKYMKSGAHRKLEGGAFSAMAIQCMAMAGSNLKAFKGGKLSLITITLGVSASGKDRAQGVIKTLLNDVDVNVYGDIRSDKDVIRSAAYDNGRCFYIKDEAHTLLGGALNGKDKNTSSIPATLMEMATTTLFKLSKLHQEEFEGSLVARRSRLDKTLMAKEDIKLGYNIELEKGKIELINKDIQKIKDAMSALDTVIESIERGIKNPALNLAALSTPQKLSQIIDEDSIESGFLGRALIFDCGVERVQNDSLSSYESWKAKKEESQDDRALYQRIKAEIGMISQASNQISSQNVEDNFRGLDHKTIATDEASRLMYNIAVHYDQYQYLNHARLGALYARISERVMSVASSLALYNVNDQGNIVVDTEHVLYALFVALKSIEHLESNLRVNEAADGETIESKLEGIKEAIVKRLKVNSNDKEEGWRFKSKLKEFLKRQKYYQDVAKDLKTHNQDAFDNSIMALLAEGKILSKGAKVKLA